MKTEELLNLGLTQEQADQIFAMNGKDVNAAKKEVVDLKAERDSLKERLNAADETLKTFDGIDPAKINDELESYKKRAEDAEANFNRQIMERDQKDWINKKLDEYGVGSPYARKQLAVDCMSAESGLTWKEGSFLGFDDFMKLAKEKDASLYLTKEEKEAAEKAAQQQDKAPKFTGPAGEPAGDPEKKKKVPLIF